MSDPAVGSPQTAWQHARALLAGSGAVAAGTDGSGTTEQITGLLRFAIAGGEGAARGDLGRHLVHTAGGDSAQLSEALELLAVAAKEHGDGDTLSYARAVHLLPSALTAAHYVRAASRLNALLRTNPGVEAMVFTGYMLTSGKGYAVNPGRARAMMQGAAAAGSADALFELYVFDTTGFGGDVDIDAATSHLHQAAKLGHARAMANLAGAYATGTTMARDESKALTWYLRAAEAGSVRAAAILSRMYGTGQGAELNADQAAHFAQRAHTLAAQPLAI